MDPVRLGRTGLQVSPVCLGGLSFGDPARARPSWALDVDAARPIVRAALEAGVFFVDTADVYGAGTSEEVLGRLLAEHASRDDVVIATKVWGRMRSGPNGGGLSRKAILTAIDGSLRRLGVDHVDLYQIHRWDPATPIEETMAALHDVVRAGKARYLGASSMWAWQLAKAQHVAAAHGWTPFVSMQDHYNLLYREEEREVLPLCLDQGLGVIPWSPLARGRLTRPWETVTVRSQDDPYLRLYGEADRAVVDRVAAVARDRGVPMAQVALAWVRRHPAVSAPIVGVTRPEHLADAVASVSIDLSEEEVQCLEEPYVPHAAVLV